MKEFDAYKVRKEIVEWIRAWFEENGPKATAVIGISGGKDSTVCAALLKEALGKERVFGVMMPRGIQPDIADSIKVVESLDIPHCTINVGAAVDALLADVKVAMEPSRDAQINTPPRMRMATLYAVAASLPGGGRVANTCNLSEDWIGYSTKYGDAAGDFSPLSDLTVQEVRAVGATFDEIPKELVQKAPSDGLCGLTDEDRFGFTYATLDRYIREGICEDPATKEKIDRMHRLNLHKLKVIPKFELK
ncbi:MAG: NAD(+) synthase [Lachnospiraceae bacterium]|nr:NAD(+) synthase [Lachnospiraceae bacterium]